MKKLKSTLAFACAVFVHQAGLAVELPQPISTLDVSVFSAVDGDISSHADGGGELKLNKLGVFADAQISGSNLYAAVLGQGATYGRATARATYYWRLVPLSDTFNNLVPVSISMSAHVSASTYAAKSASEPVTVSPNAVELIGVDAMIYLNSATYSFEGGYPSGTQRGPTWEIPKSSYSVNDLEFERSVVGDYYRTVSLLVEPNAFQQVSLETSLTLGLNLWQTYTPPFSSGRFTYLYGGKVWIDPVITVDPSMVDRYRVEVLEPPVASVPEPSAALLLFAGLFAVGVVQFARSNGEKRPIA